MPKSWFPTWVGYCPSELAWRTCLTHYGIRDEPYPTSDGRVTSFVKGNDCFCLVTFGKDIATISEQARQRLFVHESVHLFQIMCEEMGEETPSREFEAYSIAQFYGFIRQAYQDNVKSHGRKNKKAA